MARRGRFGRYPSVQPSLSNLLVSISREMQAQRDQNIMEAWRKGGTFEGKPVTDQMVLDYWNERLKSLDPKDPKSDDIRQRIFQLQYATEHSQMELRYLKKEITAEQYAKFFLRWAEKVPKDSEWWRALQKDAAALMERAQAETAGRVHRARVGRYRAAAQDHLAEAHVGDALFDAIGALTKETGLSVTGNGEKLLQILTKDFRENPGKYRALADAIAADPHSNFTGTFTVAYVAQEFERAGRAYADLATLALKSGHMREYRMAVQGQRDFTMAGQNLRLWPVATTYRKLEDQFRAVWDDPNAAWSDKRAAAAEFSKSLMALAETPGISEAAKLQLQADAARAMGQDAGDVPSFGRAQLGTEGITPKIQQQVAFFSQAEELMRTQPGQYVYAPVKPDGTFDPSGQGPVGIVPVGAISTSVAMVAQPSRSADAARMVAVPVHSVLVADPANPRAPAQPLDNVQVVQYAIGGQQVTVYGYKGSDGTWRYSSFAPFTSGTSGEFDKNGNLVLMAPQQVDPLARAQQIDKLYGTKLSEAMAKQEGVPLTGEGVSARSVAYEYKDGRMVAQIEARFDGKDFSVTRTTYGIDPQTGKRVELSSNTYPIATNDPVFLAQQVISPLSTEIGARSWLAAALASPGARPSASQALAMLGTPEFRRMWLDQTMQSLGTSNVFDSRIESEWARIVGQLKEELSDVADSRSRMPKPGQTWTRPQDRFDLSYPGQVEDKNTTENISITFNGRDIKLPNMPAYLSTPEGQRALTALYQQGGSIQSTGTGFRVQNPENEVDRWWLTSQTATQANTSMSGGSRDQWWNLTQTTTQQDTSLSGSSRDLRGWTSQPTTQQDTSLSGSSRDLRGGSSQTTTQSDRSRDRWYESSTRSSGSGFRGV